MKQPQGSRARGATERVPATGARLRRISRLTAGELRFALRYGILPLYLLITVIYLLLLSVTAPQARAQAGGVIILTDPAAMGLFFMGAMVLLEKSQRVNCALAVTPVRPGEYVLAKTFALTLVGLGVGLVVAAAAGIDLLGAGISVLLSALLFSFLGMMAAFWSESLNQFLILSIPIEIAGFLPPMFYWFGSLTAPLWLLHPGVAAMALFRDAREFWLPAALSLLVWDGIAYVACRKMAARYFTKLGGGRL